MKNKLFWLILILAGIAIIFSLVQGPKEEMTEFKPLEVNVGDVFTYLDYPQPMLVLNYMIKDVTGDGTNDMVIVVGEKEKVDDMYARNMDLIIYEPNEAQFASLKLKNMEGEMPKIQVSELTGDGVLDIVLSANGQNGETPIRIASFNGTEWKEIWKAKDNKGVVITGHFIDGLKAYVKCPKYSKEMNLDIKDRKENYVTNGFYDESGRLLKSDAQITTSPLVHYEFVELDGYSGIQTIQRVIGFHQEDLLDEITVIWKYENGKWLAKEAKGSVIGNLLY